MPRPTRRHRARLSFLEQLEHRSLLASIPGSLGPTAPSGSATIGQDYGAAPYSENVAVVRLAENANPNLLSAYGGAARATTLQNIWQVTYPSSQLVTTAIAALGQTPGVIYAEPMVKESTAVIPNDAFFGVQWGLHNTAQTYTVGTQTRQGLIDDDIDAPEAWDIRHDAMNVVVADIDTGVQYTHPDLYKNIWINQGEIPEAVRAALTDVDGDGIITFWDLNAPSNVNIGAGKITDLNGNDYIDGGDLLFSTASGGWANSLSDEGDSYVDDIIGWDFFNGDNNPMDDHGHGTHTTGTIAAMGNNGVGVTGVVWKAQVMALKFISAQNSGSDLGAAQAIAYSIAKGAKISSNSWGGDVSSTTLQDAVASTATAGQLFIAASGNAGRNIDTAPFYPASYTTTSLVSVGATDDHDLRAGFSDFGVVSVDLGAPGVDIGSTYLNSGYVYLSGTSMAAPHVSGAAVLVWSAHPTWTFQMVKDRLLNTVDVIPSMAQTVTGGRLNLAAAVFNAPPTDVALTSNHIAENLAANSVVGMLSSTDADVGDTFTYTLVDGAGSTNNANFNISGTSLRTSAVFDFESKNSYSILIRTTDQGGKFFDKPFTITVDNVIEITGLDVQNGQTQRSFVRNVDLLFADSGANLGAVANSGRLQLKRYSLSGTDLGAQSLTGVGISASNNKISLDFGVQGITGNRNTNAGDGYYTLEVDLDGNGSFDAIKRFYRLLGDVNGDRIVNTADENLILAAIGSTNWEYDTNGDGRVDALDRTLAVRSRNRQLTGSFTLDD